jgi:hypothetical protein
MFLIGLLCDAQSCYVITVFRVACCTLNVSAAGLVTQGVHYSYSLLKSSQPVLFFKNCKMYMQRRSCLSLFDNPNLDNTHFFVSTLSLVS